MDSNSHSHLNNQVGFLFLLFVVVVVGKRTLWVCFFFFGERTMWVFLAISVVVLRGVCVLRLIVGGGWFACEILRMG